MQRNKNLFALLLLAFSVINAGIYYTARHPQLMEALFNSDAVYLPTLFADLLVKHGSIKDWFLTPAPYFFPDYLIFFIAYLVESKPYLQIIAFSVIQSLLTFVLIWFLLKQILKTQVFFTTTIIFIVLLGLALSSKPPFVSLLVSGFHYGVFLSSLTFLALWIPQRKKKKTSATFCLTMAALAFLSTLSDNLFLPQVIAPLVGLALFDAAVKRNFSLKSNFTLFIVTIFSVLGSFAYKFIVTHPTRYPLNSGFGQILPKLTFTYRLFSSDIFPNPLYDILFVIYIGLVAHAFLQLKKAKMTFDPLHWLTLFSFLSLMGTLVPLLFVKSFPPTVRYFIPAFSFPVMVVFLFFHRNLSRQYFAFSVTFSLLILGSLCWNSFKLIQKNGFSTEYYPYEIACIDRILKKENVRNGVAQYWDAKSIQILSKLDLTIAPHFSNLSEMYWITSKKYFKSNYDFAIISGIINPTYKLSTQLLMDFNGPPKRIQSCGRRIVYIYGKNKLRVKKTATSE